MRVDLAIKWSPYNHIIIAMEKSKIIIMISYSTVNRDVVHWNLVSFHELRTYMHFPDNSKIHLIVHNRYVFQVYKNWEHTYICIHAYTICMNFRF